MFKNKLSDRLRLSREQAHRLNDAFVAEAGDSLASAMLEETLWLILVELDTMRVFARQVSIDRLVRPGLPRPLIQHIVGVLEELGMVVCERGEGECGIDYTTITDAGSAL
ncbi:MAG: hypothetical protein AB7F98_18050, partial [Novosphingobium sp.]